MSTANDAAVGGLTLASIWAAQPFGISIETIALGTLFSIVGVIGRAAYDGQSGVDGTPEPRKLSTILRWVGWGILGAPFATILYLVILKLMTVQSDGIVLLGLLFFGFSGPKGITWLLTTGMGLFSKRLPGLPLPPGPKP